MPVAILVVTPSAIAARLLHDAVTTIATIAKRYACPDHSPTAGDVNRMATPNQS